MLIKTDDRPSGLGYYLIDQRASGIPVFGGNTMFEADTYTCRHCEFVVLLNKYRTRPRYKCRGCTHLICDRCAAIVEAGAGCRTMEQKIDELREQAARPAESPAIILP